MDIDTLEKVQEIIKNRRNKAYSDNEARIREINEKLPQIREINDALYNTSRDLISIIAGKSKEEAAAKVEQLKRNNLEAQAMTRMLLRSNGYPEDYLDLHYTCPVCCDTGYKGERYCDCFRELYGKLASSELERNALLSASTFDTFSLRYYQGADLEKMQKKLEFCRKYADEFSTDSESILMFGRTGLGKTHLSFAIANVVLAKGYSVIYDSVINTLRSIEKEHFSREHSSDAIDRVMDCDLLILDDLGTEYETAFYNSTVYNIINTRLNSGKPTMISTNLDFKGISRRYDERVVSRIISTYKCLEFTGEDVRLQKIKEK
ncbi:MAG: ATP-binding protein [Ruminococcus sp.]|nr:ATP-binding protein [Ruminococcus sp.]